MRRRNTARTPRGIDNRGERVPGRRAKGRHEPALETIEFQRRERFYSGPLSAVMTGLACVAVLAGLHLLPPGEARRAGPERDTADEPARDEALSYHRAFLRTWRTHRPSSEVLVRSGTGRPGVGIQVEVGKDAVTGDRLTFVCQGPGRLTFSQEPLPGAPRPHAPALGTPAQRCDGSLVHYAPGTPTMIALKPTSSRARISWAITQGHDRADGPPGKNAGEQADGALP